MRCRQLARLRGGRFARLPAAELLYLCLSTHTQERVRTAKLARRAQGMDVRSQERVTKRKDTPESAPYGCANGLRVFRQHFLCWRKTGWHPCQPPFGLSFTRSPRSTGPRFKSQSSARCAHIVLSLRASGTAATQRHMLSLFALRLLLFALRFSLCALPRVRALRARGPLMR